MNPEDRYVTKGELGVDSFWGVIVSVMISVLFAVFIIIHIYKSRICAIEDALRIPHPQGFPCKENK